MTPAELGGDVLASVSRSFYLSIRILPRALREPIGLAYLLARASDTIADSNASSAEKRLHQLSSFGRMVATLDFSGLADLQREIRPPKAAEVTLIAELGPVLEWLAAMDAPARAEIQRVLEPIIRGQTLDLQRFPGGPVAEVRALATAAELEEYTYLVAGCVGEFWTRICLLRLGKRYSQSSSEELCQLGKSFGQALQLVNILRDLPEDVREGRCYLPEDELVTSGTSAARIGSHPAEAGPVYEQWLQRASLLLSAGTAYIKAIRPARVRAACYLPWKLGWATLRLLSTQPPWQSAQRVKVRRSFVYQALLRALLAAFSDAPLNRSRDD